MNNPQAIRPDYHLIATLVAAELPGLWSVSPGQHGDHYSHMTRDSDGLRITLMNDRTFTAPVDRLDVHQDYHCPAWYDADGMHHDPTGHNESLPGIKVTAKKRAAVIARDIVRRLLPDAERFHAVGLERVASHNTSGAERDRLAIALGMDSATRTDNPTATHELENTHPGASYSRAEVECSSMGVAIALDGLTAEQARAVLEAVGVELPAAVRVVGDLASLPAPTADAFITADDPPCAA